MANIYNIVSDIERRIFPSSGLVYEVQDRGCNRWIIYVRIPNGLRTAKLEFIIDVNPNDPEDVDVAASILRYGSIPRLVVHTIMDSIMERL
jgi:hypothetical protein